MATPTQTDPQFKLRMTADLKAKIEDAAAKNNRSMNAEIVHRLERSFVTDDYAGFDSEMLEYQADRISSLKKLLSLLPDLAKEIEGLEIATKHAKDRQELDK